MQQTRIISKKICMLGSFGVGKTSLVRRFVYNKFEEKYLSTIGVQISHKILSPLDASDGSKVQYKFILWDVAHIEKMNNVIRNYFRGAHGAIIVFDLTRPQVMEDFQSYLDPFIQLNPSSPLLVVGNKFDLIEDKGNESIKRVENIAQKLGTQNYLTSAKTGENVEKIFHKLGNKLLEVNKTK